MLGLFFLLMFVLLFTSNTIVSSFVCRIFFKHAKIVYTTYTQNTSENPFKETLFFLLASFPSIQPWTDQYIDKCGIFNNWAEIFKHAHTCRTHTIGSCNIYEEKVWEKLYQSIDIVFQFLSFSYFYSLSSQSILSAHKY